MNPSNKTEQKQDKILCMFSGGLDSLGVLYKLLTDSEYQHKQIHVHHIVLQNVEKRSLAEKAACERIMNYFKTQNFRPFEYSESFHDTSSLKHYFIYDTVMYCFMAANMVINDESIKQVAIGFHKGEYNNPESLSRLNKGRDVYFELLPEEMKFQRPIISPVGTLEKAEIWRILPNDLRVLSWSCRRPIIKDNIAIACQQCPTCLELIEIKKGEYS